MAPFNVPDGLRTFYRLYAERRGKADGQVIITKEERKHLHRFTSLPPQSSRVGRWRSEMSREMLAAYEEIAGDLLEELGYERGHRRRRWLPWRRG